MTTPQAVAVDGSGNVVVTGSSTRQRNRSTTTRPSMRRRTARCSGRNATTARRTATTTPTAVAVDGSGNVVVTGYSYNGTPNYDSDYYTAKYAAADGALLWEKRYNGPANSDDAANAVAVDGSGNVVVTGSSYNGDRMPRLLHGQVCGGGRRAALGETLQRPGEQRRSATAVAVDGSGNVVVTGIFLQCQSNDDYYTAKYAAADGALLWEKRYNGPANGDDYAKAVAVDGSGNVVVTGYSYGNAMQLRLLHGQVCGGGRRAALGETLQRPGERRRLRHGGGGGRQRQRGGDGVFQRQRGSYDYYTAKYAAADGALLWEKRYNGPANSDDYADGGGGGRQRQRGGDGVFLAPTGPTPITTRPSMRRRTARCSGRNATTARRTATTRPVRWRWTAAATWW